MTRTETNTTIRTGLIRDTRLTRPPIRTEAGTGLEFGAEAQLTIDRFAFPLSAPISRRRFDSAPPFLCSRRTGVSATFGVQPSSLSLSLSLLSIYRRWMPSVARTRLTRTQEKSTKIGQKQAALREHDRRFLDYLSLSLSLSLSLFLSLSIRTAVSLTRVRGKSVQQRSLSNNRAPLRFPLRSALLDDQRKNELRDRREAGMYRLSPAPRDSVRMVAALPRARQEHRGYEGFDSRAGSCHEGLSSTSGHDQRENCHATRIYHRAFFSGSIFLPRS